jgi:deaminated glutathione amidase
MSEAATTATSGRLRVGLVQMCSSRSEEANVADATRAIREAAGRGATYVQTPEFTTLMEMQSKRLFAETKPEENNAVLAHFASLARELAIHVHIGSMGVLVAPDKIANRSYLFAPDGAIAGRYDKIHMFDAALGGRDNFRESKNFAAGNAAVVARLGGSSLGMTVCYDLRFPGLYRALAQAGAGIIAIPSAFTRQTGEAHWHALMKARAIETGAWVLAAAQTGDHECGRQTYGHSLVVSPWGDVVADGGIQTSVIITDIELGAVDSTRARMPSLEHDRAFDVVRASTGPAEGRS